MLALVFRNNSPKFCNKLLDSYFFKLTLGSDCLELFFWTVSFKTIQIQCYCKNTIRLQDHSHNLVHMLSLSSTPKLSFESWFRMFIINVYFTKACCPWTSLFVIYMARFKSKGVAKKDEP